MGAWGLDILDTDTSNGVYEEFMEMYAGDIPPSEICRKLIAENQGDLDDQYERNNFWFGLALAQWETMSLDSNTYEQVKTIIDSGNDLLIWKELVTTSADLKKREKHLQKFLKKIGIARKRAKPKSSIKIKPIFRKGDCLTFQLESGNYGGAVVLEAVEGEMPSWDGYGCNLVATIRMNQSEYPAVADFVDSEILTISYDEDVIEKARQQIVWYMPDRFKRYYGDIFSVVGEIVIAKSYCYSDHQFYGSSGWHIIKEKADLQFKHELDGGSKPETTDLESVIK